MSTTIQELSAEAKAQHYIPNFYLKGFTDKAGTLWVYEKFSPMRASTPKKEAHRPDYYAHVEHGPRDETAENILKVIESRAAPIVRKLANPQFRLTPEAAGDLFMFASFMFVRVPSWREYLDKTAVRIVRDNSLQIASDKDKFRKSCADYENATGKSVGDYEKLRQYVLKGNYELEQKSKAFNLGAMFTSGLDLIEQLSNFGYRVLYAPAGKFFWTSDAPVCTLRPEGNRHATVGMGFGWPGVEVYFPLNKRTCLMLKRKTQPSASVIEAGHVDQINRLTMATAEKHLYSSEGYKRIARLFDERGCRVRPGKESFLPAPPREHGLLFTQGRGR